ncbi:MAG: hypothetical protein PHQ75_05410 [Thermoguttaceae bacterium]|nr:hypothetical protein [Thermoguttaceae bacterium]
MRGPYGKQGLAASGHTPAKVRGIHRGMNGLLLVLAMYSVVFVVNAKTDNSKDHK